MKRASEDVDVAAAVNKKIKETPSDPASVTTNSAVFGVVGAENGTSEALGVAASPKMVGMNGNGDGVAKIVENGGISAPLGVILGGAKSMGDDGGAVIVGNGGISASSGVISGGAKIAGRDAVAGNPGAPSDAVMLGQEGVRDAMVNRQFGGMADAMMMGQGGMVALGMMMSQGQGQTVDSPAVAAAAPITSDSTHDVDHLAPLDAHKMDLYSRQIGAYGLEAMGKLIKMRILIVGLRGLGAETAKNLTLAGPGAITVIDNQICALEDAGLNFFVTQQDIDAKKTRAQVSVEQLRKLNRLVDVQYVQELTEEEVSKYTCMVVTKMHPDLVRRWNKFCHARDIGFVCADVVGAAGYVFVDFGLKHLIRDSNGENPITRIVHRVSNEKEALIELIPPPDGRRHNLEMSDHDGWVSFEEIQGMAPEINQGSYKITHVFKERIDPKTGKLVKSFDAYSFRINLDTTQMGVYAGGGRMTQVKKPIPAVFRTFEENVIDPGQMLFTDGSKFGRAEQLHVGFRAIWDFQSEHGGTSPRTKNQVARVVELAKSYNSEHFDESVVRTLAKYATCELQPLSAFFGGVVAQEVVKMTGKFTPLQQWLHIDAFEVLPSGAESEEEIASPGSTNNRRDDLIRALGWETAKKLTKSSTFMVGCGALGCEFLKNLALIGVACGEPGEVVGLVTVTDNDRIEVSNLSRQFLFREENVGQPKSVAASNAAKIMNPQFNVKSLELLVAPHTESTFDDAFWQSQDWITNALDNVKARLYVDEKCVFYEKPLLESGTLGTKCNVQVILPFKTQSYADGPNDEEGDAIPMCTLRNFPSEIEHCIEWGRAQFADLFSSSAQETVNFAKNPEAWILTVKAKTVDLKNVSTGQLVSAIEKETQPTAAVLHLAKLVAAQNQSSDDAFKACVLDAYLLFHRMFRDKIVSLITSYPENTVDTKGRPFWSETKRFPRAVNIFDVHDENHLSFLMGTANLLAVVRGLRAADDVVPVGHPWRMKSFYLEIVGTFTKPETVVESVDMSGGGEDEEERRKSIMTEAQRVAEEEAKTAKIVSGFINLLEELQALAPLFKENKAKKVEAVEFEKDQDANFHIDFITAASNMRAWNYRLKLANKHQVKMIAGKIIPALATTTASVCGLVVLELLKIVQNKPVEAFKDSSNSLGINGYFFSEPLPPAKAKNEYDPIEMSEVMCYPPGFSKWDKIRIKCEHQDPTLSEFIEVFSKSTQGLQLNSLGHKNSNIKGAPGYSQFVYDRNEFRPEQKKSYQARMDVSLKKLLVEIYGEEACAITETRKFLYLETGQEDKDGNVIKVPSVVWLM